MNVWKKLCRNMASERLKGRFFLLIHDSAHAHENKRDEHPPQGLVLVWSPPSSPPAHRTWALVCLPDTVQADQARGSNQGHRGIWLLE